MRIIVSSPPRHICSPARPCPVPPSPGVIADLWSRFHERREAGLLGNDVSFASFYDFWRSEIRGGDVVGLDDGHIGREEIDTPAGLQLIDRPPANLNGDLRVLVLLVDFPDRPAKTRHSVEHFRKMLFSADGSFLTGSVREYYRTISQFAAASDCNPARGIDVDGEVYGWFRLPQPISFYTNGKSGTSPSFPRNAAGMARDAVKTALEAGINLNGYDKFGEEQPTALFIIHSGAGAEITEDPDDIWSHKWEIPGGVHDPSSGLTARTYLTVPEDCRVGVCAHELGHLAARWADYYDTGRSVGKSNGLGRYCLMAAGSWGENGLSPTLPNGMLRMFHDWIEMQVVQESTREDVVLYPAAGSKGNIALIRNPATMGPTEYIVCEYRQRKGQDRALPDEGVAIYVVDETIANVNDERELAIELIQADNRRDLAQFQSNRFNLGNQGDTTDLYPLDIKRTAGKTTKPPLNKADGTWSGVTIRVKGNPGDDKMAINVTIA